MLAVCIFLGIPLGIIALIMYVIIRRMRRMRKAFAQDWSKYPVSNEPLDDDGMGMFSLQQRWSCWDTNTKGTVMDHHRI